MILDKQDLLSPCWQKLESYLKSELSEKRAYNDGKSLSEVETAYLRGDIARLKKMLALVEDKPTLKPVA